MKLKQKHELLVSVFTAALLHSFGHGLLRVDGGSDTATRGGVCAQ
jgi:hypothetical protein